MKIILILICLLSSIAAVSQNSDTITISNLQAGSEIIPGCDGPVLYLGTYYWPEPDINPDYQSKLSNIITTYTMPVFCWQTTGEIYIYEKAYKKLVHKFLLQNMEAELNALLVIADKEFTNTTHLNIKFLP